MGSTPNEIKVMYKRKIYKLYLGKSETKYHIYKAILGIHENDQSLKNNENLGIKILIA